MRELEMSKHSDNLERLCNKLQWRFGAQDILFQQAKSELQAFQAREQHWLIRHDWSIPYGEFIKMRFDESVSPPLH